MEDLNRSWAIDLICIPNMKPIVVLIDFGLLSELIPICRDLWLDPKFAEKPRRQFLNMY